MYDNGEKEYAVHKCRHDGTIIKSHPCDCFVRGIGLDNDGNIYILCSRADPFVLKLNNIFKIVKQTEGKDAEYFSEAKGMIVTSEFVLVAADKFDRICVFDLHLVLKYNLKLRSIKGPIAIATFQNRYIVTTKGSIGMFDIDFKNEKVENETVFNFMHQDDQKIDFEPDIILRGICAIDNNIYVTQMDVSGEKHVCGLPIMCLQFDGERINYVCEDTNISRHCTDECTAKCTSVVIFCHNKTLFYSQGSYDELYHIVKATHNPGKPIESKKMFDV